MSTTSPPFTVHAIERRTRGGSAPSLVFGTEATPDQQGWHAVVTTGDGDTLHLSKLDSERRWAVDAHWLANGMPAFAMGFGSRCTLLVRPAPQLAERLDDLQAAAQDAL
jgi:hypothetical protein